MSKCQYFTPGAIREAAVFSGASTPPAGAAPIRAAPASVPNAVNTESAALADLNRLEVCLRRVATVPPDV
ncbi:hypothetical protein GCM10010277_31710 [Streptomyces longisporoflavus]|nr:hypothetical protein GCM10010277_31710 [Streptomyces longisporoflavus]